MHVKRENLAFDFEKALSQPIQKINEMKSGEKVSHFQPSSIKQQRRQSSSEKYSDIKSIERQK